MAEAECVFRPATSADARLWFCGTPASSFRGYVAVIGGEIAGIGGVFYHQGIPVAFSEMSDKMRASKKSIARAIRVLERMFDSIGSPVFAFANQKEPTSAGLLAKLGFVPSGYSFDQHGEMLVRRK